MNATNNSVTGGTGLEALLGKCLKPACDNAQVSHWLFSNAQETYHPDAGRLTAQCVEASLTLKLKHRVVMCAEGMGKKDKVVESEALLQLMPANVTVDGGIVLGYLCAVGVITPGKVFDALPAVPGSPVVARGFSKLVGRFVYDARESHLLMGFSVADGVREQAMVSMRLSGRRRERAFMVLRSGLSGSSQISPEMVSAVSMVEERIGGRVDVGVLSEGLWDVSKERMENDLTECMKEGIEAGRLREGWEVGGLKTGLSMMQDAITGPFYSPRIELVDMGLRARVFAEFCNVDAMTTGMMREVILQGYQMQSSRRLIAARLQPAALLMTWKKEDGTPSREELRRRRNRESSARFVKRRRERLERDEEEVRRLKDRAALLGKRLAALRDENRMMRMQLDARMDSIDVDCTLTRPLGDVGGGEGRGRATWPSAWT